MENWNTFVSESKEDHIKGIEAKLERLSEARKVYEELIREYPQTQFLNKSETMISDIDKEIAIFAPNQ